MPAWKGGDWRAGLLWGAPDLMTGHFRSGFGRIAAGARTGWSYGFGQGMAGWGLALLVSGAAAGMAPKGHKVSTLAGSTTGWMLGTLIGGVVAGAPGAILGGFVGVERFEKLASSPVQFMHDFAYRIRHVGMGGGYQDTYAAYTMRQRAAQEMSASLFNARQYLGQEAKLFHT